MSEIPLSTSLMNKPLNDNDSASRRQFLKSSAVVMGAVAAPYLLSQREAFAVNSDTLKVGLIGCGGRGSGAASQALAADKNVILTAMGDAFEDRLQSSLKNLQESVGKQVQVTPDHCFVGLDAFHKVIKEVDVVILTTPPGFRPAHLKAAIAAGKHVFCEKPMAVDAPGLRSVLESAAEAKGRDLPLGPVFVGGPISASEPSCSAFTTVRLVRCGHFTIPITRVPSEGCQCANQK